MKVVVTGASGFIGRRLVDRLLEIGHQVRAVHRTEVDTDLIRNGAEHVIGDLSDQETCRTICRGMDEIYHLAANSGGARFQGTERLSGLLNVVPSTQVLVAAMEADVQRVLLAGSTLVGSMNLESNLLSRNNSTFTPISSGYVMEKFFSEQLWHEMGVAGRIQTRIARLSHIYGPGRTIGGASEGVSIAMCRKAVEAMARGDHEIEIWGDGNQRRTFTYVSDAVEGIQRAMQLGDSEPVVISARESVCVNELLDLIEEIAGVEFKRRYVSDPGAASTIQDLDHDVSRRRLGWEPEVSIAEGIRLTYEWVRDQLGSDSK